MNISTGVIFQTRCTLYLSREGNALCILLEYVEKIKQGDTVTNVCAGNKAKLDFNLKDYSTKAEVLEAVDRIRYLGENTNTTGGLKLARLEVFDPAYEQRSDVDRVIVLITDGVPTYDADKLDEEVAAVKAAGIRLVALGVTDRVRQSLISNHGRQHFYLFVCCICLLIIYY